LNLMFVLPRPAGHWRTVVQVTALRPSARWKPTVKPDLDKLTRAVMDALTQAGAWTDDTRVTRIEAQKRYETTPGITGAMIEIKEDLI